ncbi:biotin synthase BioB [Cetobacterium sp.]|uniref:biotin synthase BioB n=1 Tax=Cetobacterium sp. TaxID=2071632 RepID=UPI003EE7C816
MKKFIKKIIDGILERKSEITFEEAIELIEYDFEKDKDSLKVLLDGANKIRETFHGDIFDLCTIVNAKSGNCSEDCRYCAQSSYYNTAADVYDLMNKNKILELAKDMETKLVDKFSLVTSGRGLNIGCELESLKEIYVELKNETSLHLCASHGIIDFEVAKELKNSGVQMYHHNLETSRKFYDEICTTHTYEDRIETCKNAKKAGLKVCSGGILGLGETKKDRVEMAFELKALEVDSVPINILTPIEGTPLALEIIEELTPLEVVKTIAIYRLVLPNTFIRYAGGRQLLGDYEIIGVNSGVNGALTGNYLTTTGSTIERDRMIFKEAGFEFKR